MQDQLSMSTRIEIAQTAGCVGDGSGSRPTPAAKIHMDIVCGSIHFTRVFQQSFCPSIAAARASAEGQMRSWAYQMAETARVGGFTFDQARLEAIGESRATAEVLVSSSHPDFPPLNIRFTGPVDIDGVYLGASQRLNRMFRLICERLDADVQPSPMQMFSSPYQTLAAAE